MPFMERLVLDNPVPTKEIEMAVYTSLDAGQVFSGRPSGTVVMGYDAPSERTPRVRQDYMAPKWLRYVNLWFIHSSEPLYLVGPSGCGKTSGVKQIAGMLNYPVYEVTGYGSMELADLVGHMGLCNGETVWVDGELTAAMRNGGLFLFNEMDAADPSVLVGLNSVLDGSALAIRDAQHEEVVYPAPGFRFIATANTNGSGDESGLYTGTLRQNAALQNRFMCIEAEYLSVEQERILLEHKAPTLPAVALDWLQQFTDAVRCMVSGKPNQDAEAAGLVSGMLQVPMSTRVLLRWAETLAYLEPLKAKGVNVLEKSFDLALGNFQDTATRNALHELLQRISALKATN